MLKRSILNSCFILITSFCFGQKVELKGKVIDSEDHLPLPQVNIQVIAGNDTLGQYTDIEGTFSFHLPATQRNIEITASHIGYKTYHVIQQIPLNNTFHIEMESVSEMLQETVVVGEFKGLVGTSETGKIHINTEKLSQIPSALGVPDIIKMLQLMPGVQNSGESNGYLYVRGADPGHNLMLYDDVPLYGMSHLLGIFPFYNTDHIKRIQFDKSGSDAQYGNRLSATLQAISPDQLPERFSIKGNVGLVASQLTVEAPIGNKAAVYVSGRQTYVDQILGPLISEGNEIEELTYSFSDANFTFLIKPSHKHTVSVNAFFSKDRFGIKEHKMMLDGKMKWGNHTTSATWDWKINEKTTVKQSVYFSRYTNRLAVDQASVGLAARSRVTDWGAKSLVGFECFKIPVSAGLQLSTYKVRPQEIISSQLEMTDLESDDTHMIKAWQASAFIQARPQLTQSLSADLGLRLNHYKNTEPATQIYTHLEPHLSLNYRHNPKMSYYIAYARKNQYLNLITTSSVGFPTDFWIASSAHIPASSAHNFSMGSVYKPFPGFELNASLFYSQLNHLIEYPFSILQFNEINSFENDVYIGKGKSYGVELMLRKTGRLSGWLSYTLSRSERQFNEIDENAVFPAKFDRRHNLSVVANYEISPKWSVGATQVYTSGSRFTIPTSWYFINNNPVKEYGKLNNAQMPDYIRTDISVDYFLRKTSQQESVLNFSIYNLFAVVNPIYVILDISSNETGNEVKVQPKYKKLYTILPSISWRFRF